MNSSEIIGLFALTFGMVAWMHNDLKGDIRDLRSEFAKHEHGEPRAITSSESADTGAVMRFIRQHFGWPKGIYALVVVASISWLFYNSTGW